MSRIICDESLCSGCLACVVACMDQHYEGDNSDAVSPRLYKKRVSQRSGMTSYITDSCRHCKDAACMTACPSDAIKRDERGFVIVWQEKCIGCRRCRTACPFDVPRFGTDSKMVKCDGCSVRIACGMEPACVRACNTGALNVKND